MRLFIHTLFMTSFVWMIFHFWRQLPLREGETEAGHIREFIAWVGKGVAVPVSIWFMINLGLSRWLPPFLSKVDYIKTEAAINGEPWFWAAASACSAAMSVIVSYWAALSLIGMVWVIRESTDDQPALHTTMLLWGALMLPVNLMVFYVCGWWGVAFGLVVWLAPVVHGALPAFTPIKRVPSYSNAIAKIKFGKYSEAEWEVIRELEQCENDFSGWMMLAELYAVHFHDFKQAEQTVIDLCEQPETAPSDACVALHRLADWYLELQNDPAGARRCMEAITRRYPNTHLDKMARIRLKRIPRTAEEWLEEKRNKPLHLPALHDHLDETEEMEAGDLAAVRQRAELFSQKLVRDPNDTAAREDFARALAKLNKLQAAINQMGLLLEMEGQLITHRAEWMGLKAAWMMKLTPANPEVRSLLRQIVQDFPHFPQAVAAQRRIFLMDEQARVAKYAGQKKRKRISIRLNEGQKQGQNSGTLIT